MSSILDPSLMGGGGGAPPGPGPDMGGIAASLGIGGPAGAGAAPPDAGPPASSDDLVQQAIDLIKQALDIEPDHEDKLLLEKTTTTLQQYLATNQKLNDSAMGAGPGEKFVRKQASSGGGY